MKQMITFLFAAALMAGFSSCEKVENKVKFEGGTAPVLSSSVPAGSEVPLDSKNQGNIALTLNWTNPDYMFNTGVSSQDVTYIIQVDNVGDNFSSPDLQEKSVARDLSATLTSKELNTMLAKIGLAADIIQSFEVRLKSTLGDGAVPLYSNALTFEAVPYLDVVVPLPATGKLYIVGGATPGDWGNPVPVPSQQLTQTSPTSWEITIDLIGGKRYLIIPENGQWKKYSVDNDPVIPNLWKGGDFGQELPNDIPGPPSSGTYKIVMDFKLGKFTVTPQ